MPASIDDLPPELLTRIFELVRDHESYRIAQDTLSAASLVQRSWAAAAQNELAYEVQFIRRDRVESRRVSGMVAEHFALPWLESSARTSGRCRKLTIPTRTVDAALEDVLHACTGVQDLTVEAWTTWDILKSPALKDLKTLTLDASLIEAKAEVVDLPFRLTHFIYSDDSDLTASCLTSIFSSSLSTLTHLTLVSVYPTFLNGIEHFLPLIFPALRRLHLVNVPKDPVFRQLLKLSTSLICLSITGIKSLQMLAEAGPLLSLLPTKLRRFTLCWKFDEYCPGCQDDDSSGFLLKDALTRPALDDAQVRLIVPSEHAHCWADQSP